MSSPNVEPGERFAVFILSHGRPDRCKTYDMLQNQGYTGELYIVIDNEDKTAPAYYEKFGDRVVMFDKAAVAQTFDEGDNFNDRRTVIYARNACFDIAREKGIDYFLQLDDDYYAIRHKFTSGLVYQSVKVKNLDRLFETILDYYKSIPALTIAMGQAGDILGGAGSSTGGRLWLKRKAMNSFFCSIHRPFKFFGRINEDVNTYVTLGNRGNLIFTFFNTSVDQIVTQKNAGGMTDIYMDSGTYIKTFYTVMYAPSCVHVSHMPSRHARIHHRIDWEHAVPCLVSEEHRKASRHKFQ